MFKKFRNYIKLQRSIQQEILETLCTICLYLERDGHFDRNPYSKYMGSHCAQLKRLSTELREEMLKSGSK